MRLAFGWRWAFYLVVPPGLLVLFVVGRYAIFDKGDPALARGFDWWGLALMATFLMSLQFVLEEGAKNDWFADTHILLLAVVTAVTGPVFIWRTLTYYNPIVELRAFKNRNFLVGVVMTFTVGLALFGGFLDIALGNELAALGQRHADQGDAKQHDAEPAKFHRLDPSHDQLIEPVSPTFRHSGLEPESSSVASAAQKSLFRSRT